MIGSGFYNYYEINMKGETLMGKKQTKRVAIIIIAVMGFMLFMGCSKSTTTSEVEEFDPNKEVELKVWHSWTGQEEAALKEATSKFTEKYPNVTFQLLYTPNDNYKDKLTASLQTGDGPDLFFGNHDWTGTFAAGNLIDPIDGYVKDVKDEYIESTYEAGAYNGNHYGFPLSMEAVVLIYNKDMIKEPPKTLSEFVEMAKEHTKGDKWGFVVDLNNTFYNTHGIFYGFGNTVFKDGSATPNFDNENFVSYLEFLRELKNQHKVIPKQLDYGTAQALFLEGKAAFWINGPWCFGDIEKAGVNWGATVIPKNDITNKESKPFMGVKMAFLPRTSSNKGAAAEFAKFMASAEITKMFNEMVGTIPANSKVTGLTKWSDKLIQQQAANAVAMPNIPEMNQVWNPVKDAINAVLDGDADPKEEAKKTQEIIEEKIKQARGE